MSRIRGKNTGPELIVRKLVFSMGFRYRLHYGKLPGKPDLVFPGRKKVIFVHGCFWHGHKKCKRAGLPKTRIEFWEDKIRRNQERDQEDQKNLLNMGWDYLVIWQCELKDVHGIKDRISSFFNMLDT